MRAENWNKSETEIAGWPVTITSYKIGNSAITEIASVAVGANVARAVADTAEASLKAATEAATRRLGRTRRFHTAGAN